MAQLWYGEEMIGEVQYNIHPVEGDIIVAELDGHAREFIVSKVRKYYPLGAQPLSRIELSAYGGWDFAYSRI